MFSNNEIEQIYNLYVDDLFAYALHLGFDRYIVMDAIHDVFVKLCTDYSAGFDNIQNIKFYLFRALRNTLINTVKSKISQSIDIQDVNETFAEPVLADSMLLINEKEKLLKDKIDHLLSSLTKRQYEMVYLRYVEEYDYDQISEIMNITPGACRKLMHKAMKSLRDQKNTTSNQ